MKQARQLTIIGSGPAGLTAALYAARARLQPLIVASSVEAGGDLMTTTDVDNFPGFPEGILGPDLVAKLREQAERFGAEIIDEDVETLEVQPLLQLCWLSSGEVIESRALIFATGSAYRKLGIPDEARLTGNGVSWCATCDGFFFRGRVVAVIGGGDAAMEEATFLSRFASKVYVIHRRSELRASQIMQQRAIDDPKVEFIWNAEPTSILGTNAVDGIQLRDRLTGTTRRLDVDGVFIAIGSDPRTHLIHGSVELAPDGTVAVRGRTSLTSARGVFAAGDVIDPRYRQAVTAAASGAAAALDAEHYLSGLADRQPDPR